MLMVWFDRGESVTFNELSRALKALGKDRLAKKYCGFRCQIHGTSRKVFLLSEIFLHFLNFKVCLTNTIPTFRSVYFVLRKDHAVHLGHKFPQT